MFWFRINLRRLFFHFGNLNPYHNFNSRSGTLQPQCLERGPLFYLVDDSHKTRRRILISISQKIYNWVPYIGVSEGTVVLYRTNFQTRETPVLKRETSFKEEVPSIRKSKQSHRRRLTDDTTTLVTRSCNILT